MEEVRLIDANALHKRIEMNLRASNPFTIEECCYKDALNSVDEAPAIDPESLRQTAHIIRGTVPETKDGVFCDNCNRCLGDEYGTHVIGYFKYCPYCGFKLEDGTEKET